MANTDFSILLNAIINKSGITTELKQVQQIVNKYSIDIMPELKTASLRNQMKSVSKDIANDFNKAFGTNLTGNDVFKAFESQAKQAENAIKQQKKAIEEAKKAQEQYNQRVKEGKALASKQANDASLSKQKSLYDEIANNQKQVYSLKQKLISADTIETQELNKQINILEKRNKYLNYKTNKSGLSSSAYEKELSVSKQIYENQLKIKQASVVDKSINNENKKNTEELKKQATQLENNRKLAWKYTKVAQKQLQTAISKYSYGDNASATALSKQLGNGVINFKDLNNVGDEIDNYKSKVEGVIKTLEQSHKTNLNIINDEISKETKLEDLKKQASTIKTSLDNGSINTSVSDATTKYQKLSNVTTELQTDFKQLNTLQTALGNSNTDEELISNYEKFSTTLSKVNNQMKVLSNEQGLTNSNNKLNDSIEITKNRATSAVNGLSTYSKTLKPQALKENASRIREISDAFVESAKTGNKAIYSKATASLSNFKSEMKSAGNETTSLTQTIKDNIGAFTNWYLIGGAISSLIGNFKSAIVNIAEVDTQLTEISKTSNLSGDALKQLGIDAYDSASKYGTTIKSYLAGYLEMSRGTDEATAKGLASLSILAQSAGDMTAELANNYIVATNAAYGYNNEVSKLNAALDGANQITNRNQVSMTDIATATSVAGSQAAQAGVEIDKMTAATGTMIATTKQGGEVAGRAYKAILMNLMQVSGETEDGEVLNEGSFKKAEKSLNSVGIATEELVNGTAKLRDPMLILKELSAVYNSLPSDSAQKANIISGLGGKVYHVIQKCVTRIYLIAGNPLEPYTTI